MLGHRPTLLLTRSKLVGLKSCWEGRVFTDVEPGWKTFRDDCGVVRTAQESSRVAKGNDHGTLLDQKFEMIGSRTTITEGQGLTDLEKDVTAFVAPVAVGIHDARGEMVALLAYGLAIHPRLVSFRVAFSGNVYPSPWVTNAFDEGVLERMSNREITHRRARVGCKEEVGGPGLTTGQDGLFSPRPKGSRLSVAVGINLPDGTPK